MSFSPIVRVRKLLDKMKSERDSPRLRRFLSRSSSGAAPSDEVTQISTDSMEWNLFQKMEYPTENHIHILPEETLFMIFSYLNVQDILAVRSTSKEWYHLADDNLLWKDLCLYDWNVASPLASSWKGTYMKLDDLFSEGNWEGMSKWVEPEGFDNEQKTTTKLHFQKRRNAFTPIKIASPSMIHRVDSTANSSTLRSADSQPAFKDSVFKITGTGVTVNCASHSYFKIEGERISNDSTGATFKWNKQFEKHTSVYVGKVDYQSGTVSGQIDYHDGSTHWKGIFEYTKSNRKLSKYEEMRLA